MTIRQQDYSFCWAIGMRGCFSCQLLRLRTLILILAFQSGPSVSATSIHLVTSGTGSGFEIRTVPASLIVWDIESGWWQKLGNLPSTTISPGSVRAARQLSGGYFFSSTPSGQGLDYVLVAQSQLSRAAAAWGAPELPSGIQSVQVSGPFIYFCDGKTVYEIPRHFHQLLRELFILSPDILKIVTWPEVVDVRDFSVHDSSLIVAASQSGDKIFLHEKFSRIQQVDPGDLKPVQELVITQNQGHSIFWICPAGLAVTRKSGGEFTPPKLMVGGNFSSISKSGSYIWCVENGGLPDVKQNLLILASGQDYPVWRRVPIPPDMPVVASVVTEPASGSGWMQFPSFTAPVFALPVSPGAEMGAPAFFPFELSVDIQDSLEIDAFSWFRNGEMVSGDGVNNQNQHSASRTGNSFHYRIPFPGLEDSAEYSLAVSGPGISAISLPVKVSFSFFDRPAIVRTFGPQIPSSPFAGEFVIQLFSPAGSPPVIIESSRDLVNWEIYKTVTVQSDEKPDPEAGLVDIVVPTDNESLFLRIQNP